MEGTRGTESVPRDRANKRHFRRTEKHPDSGFHPGADRLLKSIPNCVGVDGEKLFDIVKKTAYGIHRTSAGYTFDEAIFGL